MMIEESVTKSSVITETLQKSDTIYAQYAVFQGTMNSIVMLQCFNFKIWQQPYRVSMAQQMTANTHSTNTTMSN